MFSYFHHKLTKMLMNCDYSLEHFNNSKSFLSKGFQNVCHSIQLMYNFNRKVNKSSALRNGTKMEVTLAFSGKSITTLDKSCGATKNNGQKRKMITAKIKSWKASPRSIILTFSTEVLFWDELRRNLAKLGSRYRSSFSLK